MNNLYAQDSFVFEQLSANNFPTQSITYAVKQDSIGNVWIASEEGVLKYNSKTIKVYNTYNGLPEQVSNRISALFIDSKQRIWAGMENGVCLLDKSKDIFVQLKSTLDINPSLINTINEDEEGTIWIGGYNGLWKVNQQTLEAERILENLNIKSLFPSKKYIAIGTLTELKVYDKDLDELYDVPIENSQGIWFIGSAFSNIYVGTRRGAVYVFDKNLRTVKEVNIEKKIHFPIFDIIEGTEQNLLIATDGDGLYSVDKESFKILNHVTEDADNKASLNANGIYDIEYNKTQNTLWIATYGGGINYYNFNKKPFKRFQHIINDKNSIATNFSKSIEQDSQGRIWFGTTKGISIWNPKNNKWKQLLHLSDNPDFAKDIILALKSDGNYIWAGTYDNGLFKINTTNFSIERISPNIDKNLSNNKIYAITKDQEGSIWFGGVDEDLTVIQNGKTYSFPISQVKSIIVSKAGNILAAGRFGVFKINPKEKQFELIEELRPNKQNLAYSTINSLSEFNNNYVLGTNGAGLVIFNTIDRTFKKLNMASGLPSDIVQGVIVENNNTIWASTTKGLAEIQFTEKDTIINIYDKNDGLASTEFNYGSYKKINDSLMAFGGTEGITLFNPRDIIRLTEKPNLVFDDFKLFNKIVESGSKPLIKHIDQTKELTLKSNQNSIEIGFTGVLHNSAPKVKYSWILEGFNENWSIPNSNNFATFTNLSSDEYVFKVKAFNKYGEAGEERSLNIKILSPWWATGYAIFLYFLLAIGIILLGIHFTSVMINKKNADEQINFFNNITHEIKTPLSILLSSLDGITNKKDENIKSNKQIKTTIKRINSLFEQMLNFHKVTSENHLSLNISKIDIEDYFNKIVQDFEPLTKEHNLTININNNYPSELFYHDIEIMDKILHNLLSNAIKYSNDDNKIDITFSKNKTGQLKIEITDYGMGIPKDQQKYILKRYYRARNVINSQRPGTGLGLIMVKRLIEKTGGSISFNSIENVRTTFSILLKSLKSQYTESLNSKTEIDNQVLSEIEEQITIDAFSDSKILVVEDNDELRSSLVNTLSIFFQVFEAKNGSEGLSQASVVFPDLIITDLIMPEMDGLEMAKQIKADINFNHIPIFMLSVLHNSVQRQESIESGITEYFEKPVDIKLLLAKISNILNWQQNLRQKYIHDNDKDNAILFRNKSDQNFLENLEKEVISHIEDNNYSVHDLSKSFGMSRTSLYMKLKNLVDLSPQDFIIHTKLKQAKKLLIKGEYSIKEVAYNSGFSNPKYFSTSFKKFYGMTPSGFIESLQNK